VHLDCSQNVVRTDDENEEPLWKGTLTLLGREESQVMPIDY